MTYVVSTAPAEEPITVDEAKVQLRIDNTYDDAEITGLIIAARIQAELNLHRYLITQTVDSYYDYFKPYFSLPPLQSVSSITYLDSNGDSQTLAADQYVVDSKSVPARVTPAYGVSWPSTYDQTNAVTIQFIAGYGAASAVPECIKQWIKLQVSHYYENRNPLIVGTTVSEMPRPYIDGLLDSERVLYRV